MWVPSSVANLAFFLWHWASFDAHLRDFFVSCGLHIFGLVLTTLAGFGAYVTFFLRFSEIILAEYFCNCNLWAINPPADVTWMPPAHVEGCLQSAVSWPYHCITVINDNNSQSNLRRARRSCRTIQRSPIGYSGMPQISPPKLPLTFGDHHPSNTPIIRLTPLTIPNGIRIHSAVLPQYTFRQTHRCTHTQTVRWARRQVKKMSAYARCTNTERHANNLLEHRYAIACSGMYVDRAYNGNINWSFFLA